MQPSEFPLHLIPLLPLLGAAINLLLGKRLGKAAGTIGSLSVLLSAALGWYAASSILWSLPEGAALHGAFFSGDWIFASEPSGVGSVHIRPGLLLDHLSCVMVLTVTTIGFLIHLYSTSYMEEDEGIARYFGYLNLFTGSMLILVLGDSLPVTFVGWEGVGLCSYLLIGFWYTKEANAYAGRKAFIVNRVGDLGFLLGMFMVFVATSTFDYGELATDQSIAALHGVCLHGRATYATVASLLLFVGATGKSAQLPLYIWLPDAMAGPTPVSALIHAATMVTAGVYMVARLHFLFAIDPFVLGVIASVGAVTALFAATMGITQKPIKKILAYSTISQLGFMFVGVATANYTTGVFHLVTHAFFKAGLFLGAGSIMHALHGEEDVTKMGGLKAKLPVTRWTFLIYCFAIAGIFPFAGFFSKDAILAGAFEFGFPEVAGWPHWLGHVIYGVALAAAACTAFYMFRAYFLVFEGKFRGEHHTWDYAHESPWPMALPLIVLAFGSVATGFLAVPEPFQHFFHGEGWNYFDRWLVAPKEVEMSAGLEWGLMGVATAVSVGGILLARSFYANGVSPTAERIAARANGLYRLVSNKYYVDELYDLLIVRPLRATAFFLWKVVDAFIIDLLAVRGTAFVVDVFGRTVRYLQNGDVQRGVVGVLVGTAAIVAVGSNWTAWRAAGFTTEIHGADVTVKARGVPPSAGNRPLKYVYDFGDGTPVVEKETPTASHHYAGAGKHKITVAVTDPRWHSVARESRIVLVKEAGGPVGAYP